MESATSTQLKEFHSNKQIQIAAVKVALDVEIFGVKIGTVTWLGDAYDATGVSYLWRAKKITDMTGGLMRFTGLRISSPEQITIGF